MPCHAQCSCAVLAQAGLRSMPHPSPSPLGIWRSLVQLAKFDAGLDTAVNNYLLTGCFTILDETFHGF